MLGPGDAAPGPTHVAVSDAHAWAIAAADAAVTVPATNAEAAAWTVRGWADVAIGCLTLDGPAARGSHRIGPDPSGAFAGLDEVVRAVPVVSGGGHAARLRQLRELAGPVPPWYPDARPVAGPIRSVGRFAWQAADLVARFGEELMMTGTGLPWRTPCPLSSARQLAWGARYRPSPSDAHRTVRLPVSRFLARRTWMCLPGRVRMEPGPGPVVAEVPSTASPLAQQIWRGIHEGAHLDHLSALTALGPAAPSPAESGAGLMIAESYAMAVEILAAVECVLAEEGHAVWQLGAGLIERATRLPGGANPAPEFTDLPTLAEVYVWGPLDVLTGAGGPHHAVRTLGEQIGAELPHCAARAFPEQIAGAAARVLRGQIASDAARALRGQIAGDAARALPEQIVGALRARWRSACTAYPPAAAFGSAAAQLLGRSPRLPGG